MLLGCLARGGSARASTTRTCSPAGGRPLSRCQPVQQIGGHAEEAVQEAFFALVLLRLTRAALALFALGAREAAFTQALVGLQTHTSVTAHWLTLG